MIGIIPYGGVSFATNEMLKKHWIKKYGKGPNTLEKLFIGGIAGLSGQAASHPLDVVRRRMQTPTELGIDAREYKSMRGTFSAIVKKEGYHKGLFKGFSINCIKTPIASGMAFLTYDICKEFSQKVLLESPPGNSTSSTQKRKSRWE